MKPASLTRAYNSRSRRVDLYSLNLLSSGEYVAVKVMGCSSVFEWLCCVCHKHALALAHASRGGKCKRRGSPPLERSDQRSGGGVAQRGAAQEKRGRLGGL